MGRNKMIIRKYQYEVIIFSIVAALPLATVKFSEEQ